MNAELLLAHFNRISDAPNAVPRLRQFILDLAVRGKLVEQDPADEPAAELLRRIQSEKMCLTREGKVRSEAPTTRIEADEEPFLVPAKWEWVRLRDILIKLTDGTHHSPPNLINGDFKYITAKNIKPEGVSLEDVTYVSGDVHQEVYSRCNPEKGDILYIKDGATTGIATINNLDEPFTMLSSVALLKLARGVYNRLIVEFLRSPFFYLQMRGFMKGAAITRVTLKRMAPALVPLPPSSEQHRIVAKVDELMALCDQLEAAQGERDSRLDRLAAACHHHLNNGSDAKSLRSHAQFFIGHLRRLTGRPYQIKQIRQTVLNLAVRGKLVHQDSSDLEARTIIDSITQTRKRLIAEERFKPMGPLTIRGDETKFDYPVPSRWLFCFVDDFALKVTDGEHATPQRSQSGYYLLSARNVTNNGIDVSDVDFVPEAEYRRIRKRCDPDKGDVLISCSGSIGRVAIVDQDNAYTMVRSAALVKLDSSLINSTFIAYALRAIPAQEQIQIYSKSTAQANLFIGAIRKLRIPLPPLAEQHRIVAKVDELMTLCNQLESKLMITQNETSHLLESVLHTALDKSALVPQSAG